jgi:GTP-binding protein Era
VAVVGRPNVGKSTLVNRLVGQKVAIVSDKPQTTRNRILAVVNRPAGQIVLFDTPGIHKPMHKLNERMVETAVRSVAQVELVLWLVDVTQPYGPGDRYVCEILRRAQVPVLLGINKIDALPKPRILEAIARYKDLLPFVEVVPVSALGGENVELLATRLLQHLPVGPPLYPDDFLTDQPERFFVGEMIREQILRKTRDELPYSTGVVIDAFKEPDQHTADPAFVAEASVPAEAGSTELADAANPRQAEAEAEPLDEDDDWDDDDDSDDEDADDDADDDDGDDDDDDEPGPRDIDDTAAQGARGGEAFVGRARPAAVPVSDRSDRGSLPVVRIEASILVERDSQKAIVIGRGGEMLKAIGSAARREIETFLGTRVFLGLFVKVRPHWREDPHALDQLGLPGKD